jgi:hypothetical protein
MAAQHSLPASSRYLNRASDVLSGLRRAYFIARSRLAFNEGLASGSNRTSAAPAWKASSVPDAVAPVVISTTGTPGQVSTIFRSSVIPSDPDGGCR